MKHLILLTTLIIIFAFACEQKKPLAEIGIGDDPGEGGTVEKLILKKSNNNNLIFFNTRSDTDVVYYNLKLDTAYLIITTDTIR
jgi:hypothetical protein